MKLSPFGPPRSEPRRPDIGDMRAVTRRALFQIGLVPLGIGMLGLLSSAGSRSFFAGLVVASAFVVVAYSLSISFETKHLDESRDFWRRREAVIRPRMLVAALGIFVAGGVTLTVAAVTATWDVAGLLLAPVFLAGSIVLLLWGKVP